MSTCSRGRGGFEIHIEYIRRATHPASQLLAHTVRVRPSWRLAQSQRGAEQQQQTPSGSFGDSAQTKRRLWLHRRAMTSSPVAHPHQCADSALQVVAPLYVKQMNYIRDGVSLVDNGDGQLHQGRGVPCRQWGWTMFLCVRRVIFKSVFNRCQTVVQWW